MSFRVMVNRIVLATLFLPTALLCGELVVAADHPAFEPVKELFAAMSIQDGRAMKATATKDFQLLEHGEDWSMQMLVDAVQPNGKPYKRRNYFSQIRAQRKGDVAWLTYWNKAEILRNGKSRTLVWLESAVVIQVQEEWKVQMLHSTRVDADKHPQDIRWAEHVPPHDSASTAKTSAP